MLFASFRRTLTASQWRELFTNVGSHRQHKHPLKPGRVTIAGKASAELPPGTERSILKQAGLDRRTHDQLRGRDRAEHVNLNEAPWSRIY